MTQITCGVVQETSITHKGSAHVKVNDLGGGMIEIEFRYADSTTRMMLTQTPTAQLHAALGEAVARNEEASRPLKAV